MAFPGSADDYCLCFCSSECADFAPKPITLPPSSVQFQTMSAVLSDANSWLVKNPTKKVVAVNVLELPFSVDMMGEKI